jgi:hypothetical protein
MKIVEELPRLLHLVGISGARKSPEELFIKSQMSLTNSSLQNTHTYGNYPNKADKAIHKGSASFLQNWDSERQV